MNRKYGLKIWRMIVAIVFHHTKHLCVTHTPRDLAPSCQRISFSSAMIISDVKSSWFSGNIGDIDKNHLLSASAHVEVDN